MTDKQRMLNLVKALDSNEEILIGEKEAINEDAISKEQNRMRELWENSFNNKRNFTPLPGQTVNSVNNENGPTQVVNSLNSQDISGGGITYPGVKNINTNLQPNEALIISIKRTLASGAPVNDLSFYDEVNWHLVNLGFSSQSPVMIKEMISGMVNKDC